MSRLKAVTLFELIMVIMMFSVVAVVTVIIFRTILVSWDSLQTRSGISIVLDRAIERMSMDLREAREIQSNNDYEIRFRQGEADYFIYYLRNTGNSYELRRDSLLGDIGGTYGLGQVIAFDIADPLPASFFSIDSNIVTIDISVQRNDETMRARTQIRPRNIFQ